MRQSSKSSKIDEPSLSYRKGKNPLRHVMSRLRNRPDSEHEMSYNRLVFNFGTFTYIIIASWSSQVDAGLLMMSKFVFSCYLIGTIAIVAHILYDPDISPKRRVLAIMLDISAITLMLTSGGEQTAFMFALFLWLIFGNGFRFGVPYLAIASMCSVAGFIAVVTVNPFWHDNLSLSVGLLLALIVLPGYAAVLIRKLSAARELAEEASRSKSLFLASVSHELRTPLNSIIGLSDLLETGETMSAEQTEMVQTIGHSGRSLLSLIKSVLDLSRIEAGKMPAVCEPLDLFALAGRLHAIMNVQARKKNIELRLFISADTPEQIVACQSHLEEVLMNLLSNAIKFTNEGFVVLAISALQTSATHCRLSFAVQDTGIGIHPDAQERIFENFTQADESILDKFGGTGLGLAIAREMVALHGGKLAVQSAPGAGSTFSFELEFPVQDIAASGDGSIVTAVPMPVVAISADFRVRFEIDRVFPNVLFAARFEELPGIVAQMGERNISPQIIFADTGAEGYAGGTALRRVCAESHVAAVPVIAIGAHEHAMPDADIASDFSSFVRRPVQANDLHALARRVEKFRLTVANKKMAAQRQGESFDILVAEDNVTNQMVISKILDRAKHRVCIVSNGEQALEKLTSNSFDLVFMDINMPVLNGIEATRLYQFTSNGRELAPIFALTADATSETEAKCRVAGMAGCITKPINASTLLDMIDQFMKGRTRVHSILSNGEEAEGNGTAADSASESAHAVLDKAAINDLLDLGGPEFVHDLVNQFLSDAVLVLSSVAQAVASEDAEAFRDQAHALRSSAANIGARNIYKLCLSWRDMTGPELTQSGESFIAQLSNEFMATQNALEIFIAALEQKARNGHSTGDKDQDGQVSGERAA